MISQGDVRRLAALRSDDGILSVYVKLDPRLRYERGQAAAKFKGGLARFLRTADETQTEVARREQRRVLDYLDGTQPQGRGLVIFTSEPANVWEVIGLEVLIPTMVTVDTTTNTGLLARVVDEYPRFVLAVVQRDRATVYTSEQRSAEQEADIKSDVPGQHDQGGWAQARFQRHIEVHVERHLKALVDELKELYYAEPFNRLVLGGVDDVVAQLTGILPEPLPGLVIGTFGVDFKHATEAEIMTDARKLMHEFERRHETELVSRLFDAAGAGGQGAMGVDETLEVLPEGRVDTLVVADDFSQEGMACTACDYATVGRIARCRRCGGEVEAVPDVIDRAVEAAFFTDARVEVVVGEARQRLLERGGVGALLRY